MYIILKMMVKMIKMIKQKKRMMVVKEMVKEK
jgi:hypothetical protein